MRLAVPLLFKILLNFRHDMKSVLCCIISYGIILFCKIPKVSINYYIGICYRNNIVIHVRLEIEKKMYSFYGTSNIET